MLPSIAITDNDDNEDNPPDDCRRLSPIRQSQTHNAGLCPSFRYVIVAFAILRGTFAINCQFCQ
jgi:hypothetical protein